MGLPLFNNPALQGNLFIHFEIEFPKNLTEDQLSQIAVILSAQKPKELKSISAENTHECIPFEKSHVNENKKERNEAYDDDDEEGGHMGGGQQVKCQNG